MIVGESHYSGIGMRVSIMEIQIDKLKQKKFVCSERECAFESVLSFNKSNVIWQKCQGNCKEKKDVNMILEANNVDMLDKRLEFKCYVSIMFDSNNLPFYYSDQNEEIEFEDVKFVANDKISEDIKDAVEKLSIKDKNDKQGEQGQRDQHKQQHNLTSKEDTQRDKLDMTEDQSQMSTAPNSPVTNGLEIVDEESELKKEQVCPQMLKHQNMSVDLTQIDWRILRQAHLEFLCIDKTCDIYQTDKSETQHIKKNCGNLKCAARKMDANKLRKPCRSCMLPQQDIPFTIWLKDIEDMPKQ